MKEKIFLYRNVLKMRFYVKSKEVLVPLDFILTDLSISYFFNYDLNLIKSYLYLKN